MSDNVSILSSEEIWRIMVREISKIYPAADLVSVFDESKSFVYKIKPVQKKRRLYFITAIYRSFFISIMLFMKLKTVYCFFSA